MRLAHEAAACYDLGRAAEVKRRLDAFAVAVADAGDRVALEDLRGRDGVARLLNYTKGRLFERPYVDLFDLAQRAARDERFDPTVRAAATELATATDAFVLSSFGMHGLKGFQPGRHGVFLVFPDGDAVESGQSRRAWERVSWYTPLPAQDDGAPYGDWAFLADGAIPDNGEVETWFELLDSWYDRPTSDGDPGGVNGYLP